MAATLGVSVADGIATMDSLPGQYVGLRLDIGCGANKQAGWFGIDMQPLPGVDLVHDIMVYPWPLPDECALTAVASHLVEHIPPHNFGFIKFMNEVWRLLKPGGQFAIVTPHGWSAGYLQDPTHCNPCNENTWAYFDPEHPSGFWQFYQPKPWKVEFLSWDYSANIEVVLAKRSD